MCRVKYFVLGLIISIESAFGVEYRQAPEDCYTPQLRLFFYACEGSVEGVGKALEEGADIDQVSRSGYSALHFATHLNRKEVVAFLLEKKASPDVLSGESKGPDWKQTPLMLATVVGHFEVCELLIEAGADPSFQSPYNGMSAAHYALKTNRVKFIKAFITTGTDISLPVKDQYGTGLHMPALTYAVQHGSLEQVKRLVEDYTVPVYGRYKYSRQSPLHTAVAYGNYEVVKYLIAKGADVNLRLNGMGSYRGGQLSPLALASIWGRDRIAALLLENGAKPIKTRSRDYDPVFLADALGYEKTLKVYESYGYKSDYWGRLATDALRISTSDMQLDPPPVKSIFTAKQLQGEWIGWKQAESQSDVQGIKLAIISDDSSRDIGSVLQVEWSSVEGVEVYERDQLDHLLREQKLDRSGLLDGKGIAALPEITGVNTLILIRELDAAKKANLYEIQLIDARRGILLDLRIVPTKSKNLEDFCRSFVASSMPKLSKLNADNGNLMALAVVNVRSDFGSHSGLQLEQQARLLLEYELSKQPNVLLMQRQDLEKLQRENNLSGVAESEFIASAGFVDARLELNEEKDAIVAMHLRLAFPSRDEKELKVEATGDALPNSLRVALPQLINRSEDDEQPTYENSLRSDVKRLVREARWLHDIGMHAQSLDYIRNAHALATNKKRQLRLYLECLNDSYPELPEHNKFADPEDFQKIFLHEQERLYVMDAVYRLLSEQGGGVVHALSDAHENFEYTIASLDAVSLHRRYSDQIRILEENYVSMVERRIVPLYSFYRKRDGIKYNYDPRDFQGALRVFRSLREVDELSLETCAKKLIKAFSAQYDNPDAWHLGSGLSFRCNSYPESSDPPRWMRVEQLMHWLVEYANPYVSYDFLTEMNYVLDSRWRFSVKKAECWREVSAVLLSKMTTREKFITESFVGHHNNAELHYLWQECAYVNAGPVREVHLGERIYWRSKDNVATKALRPDRPNQKFTGVELDPVQLRHTSRLLEDAIEVSPLSNTRATELRVNLDQHLRNSESEQNMNVARLHRNGMMSVAVWHPEAFGYKGYRSMHQPSLYSGNWYVLATNRSPRQHINASYVLFTIDAETYETSAQKFNSSNFYGFRYDSVCVVGDKWLAFEGPKGSPITFLNLSDLATHTLKDYRRGGGGNFPYLSGQIIDGKFYEVVAFVDDIMANPRGSREWPRYLISHDLELRKTEIIANSRRRPAVSPLDKLINKVTCVCYDETQKKLLFLIRDKLYGMKIGESQINRIDGKARLTYGHCVIGEIPKKYHEIGLVGPGGNFWIHRNVVSGKMERFANRSALPFFEPGSDPVNRTIVEIIPKFIGEKNNAYNVIAQGLEENECILRGEYHLNDRFGYYQLREGGVAFFKTKDLGAALKESDLLPDLSNR